MIVPCRRASCALFFFFSSRRRHTRCSRDWSSDVCSSDLADAVVVYVALAGENEPEAIRYTSGIGEACERLGMPFIAEAEYPNAYQSLDTMSQSLGAEYLKRNARLCAELGADIVKVNWSGDAASFA